MSRSLAAAPGRRRTSTPRTRRSAPKASRPTFGGVIRPATAVAGLIRAAAMFVLRHRRLRIALLAAVVAVPLLGCGWLWFRQSSFVAVRQVEIVGVHGAEAQAVQAALTQAAHGMSTLDVSDDALTAAVAPLRVVRAVSAIPSFPHGLRIEVSEQLPVAALTVGGVRTAVAADGVVLGPALLSGSLPSVSGFFEPAPGRRASGPNVLAALAILGAAPAPLAAHVERVFTGAKGLTVAMRNGLLVYFGDASRPLAKWLSLARVLADQSSAGASYVDVRLPSHPAAGFPAGVMPPDAGALTGSAGSGSAEPTGSTESTVAALAAGLASGTSTTTTPAGAEPSSASSTGAATPSESHEASSGETGSESQPEASQTTPQPGG
jgi:cell division protein FtsQ